MQDILIAKSGVTVQVDDIDFWFVLGLPLKLENGYIYVGKIALHRLIAERAGIIGDEIDHKNRNRLDCTRLNLRSATHSQNNFNKKPSANKHGFPGIVLDKRRNKYRGRVKVNGKFYLSPYCDNPGEAYAAYCRLALIHFGEFADVKINENT